MKLAKLLLFWASMCAGSTAFAQAQPEVAPPPGAGSTTITVVPGSRVAISGPTEICKGGQTILKVEGEYESFEWNTGSTERYIKVSEEGVYEVTVKTKGGCSFTSSVNVRMRPCT